MPNNQNEDGVRPSSLSSIIGMNHIKEVIRYDIIGSFKRNDRFPAFMLSGPPGLGKTTVAHAIAHEIKSTVVRVMGASLIKPSDIYDLASQSKDRDVIFIEEAHGIRGKAADTLKPWMDEGVIVGNKDYASHDAPNVIFILTSTNIGMLDAALRNRCRILHLDFYTHDELKQIIRRAAEVQGYNLRNEHALALLARSSRGTARTAIEQRLQRVLNIMAVDRVDFSEAVVRKMFNINEINENGLEKNDIIYLNKLYDLMSQNNGRPASFNTMCQVTGFSDDVIQNTIESYLIHIGAINVNTKGRAITKIGLKIINKEMELNMSQESQTSVASASVSSNNINNINKEELRQRIENKEITSVRDICTEYRLRYGADNPLIKNLLEEMGYEVRRRAGIVKIKN